MEDDWAVHYRKHIKEWSDRITRNWQKVLTTIASIVGITLFVVYVLGVKETIVELIYVIELSVFCISLIIYVIIQEYRFLRKARYAEAMSSIHGCVHLLRDYHFGFENIDKEVNCKKALTEVVTSFTNAFSLATGAHCRACIKTIEMRHIKEKPFQKLKDINERVKHLYISTFCRDTNTSLSPSKKSNDTCIHPIISNTDFSELYLDIDNRCFFHNDLSTLHNYQNSSMKIGELPYRSTIVWPIRRILSEQDKDTKAISNQEQDIIGFLCIDSAKKNAFRKTYDFEMGAIVADSLFVFLKSYHTFLNAKEGNN